MLNKKLTAITEVVMAFGTFLEGFCVSSAILYVAVNFPVHAHSTGQSQTRTHWAEASAPLAIVVYCQPSM